MCTNRATMQIESSDSPFSGQSHWFAIRTRNEFLAEAALSKLCDEVYFPKEIVRREGKKPRQRAIIPHVLFIKTEVQKVKHLEKLSHTPSSELPVSFWIYRYPQDTTIRIINQKSIDLLKLLTAADSSKCEIFNKTDFQPQDRVLITDGQFKGYEGFVKRIKKNKHVVVEIQGICMIMLPFIHPDFLMKI